MSSILIQDVSKTFETKDGSVQALKHVSLSIETGDIYGIIGMSGAGKSTLVRCMNFLEVPYRRKSIKLDRKIPQSTNFPKRTTAKSERNRMIFQHFNLLMQKNVLETSASHCTFRGRKKPKQEQKPWSFWKS